MNRKNIIIASLVAIISVTATYIFWPEEAPTGEMHIDPAAKTAKLFDHMVANLPSQAQQLPAWQDPAVRVINGHRVPPVPDPKVNNATLLGVDTDNDGVRDDVNRYIAERFKDPVMYANAIEAQRAEEYAMQNPSKKNVEAVAKIAACTPGNTGERVTQLDKLSELTHISINTGMRSNAYARTFAGMVGYGCEHFK